MEYFFDKVAPKNNQVILKKKNSFDVIFYFQLIFLNYFNILILKIKFKK